MKKKIKKLIWKLLGLCPDCGSEIKWWDYKKGTCSQCGKEIA